MNFFFAVTTAGVEMEAISEFQCLGFRNTFEDIPVGRVSWSEKLLEFTGCNERWSNLLVFDLKF